MKNNVGLLATGSAILGFLLISGTAFAAGPGFGHGMMGGRAPGVFGTVSAVNGNSLTVQSKGFGENATATTYTVNAAAATVTKNGSASSVSSIAVGDTIMAAGTVNGTSVTATTIRDGAFGRGMMGRKGEGQWSATSTPPAPGIQGNGQPVVGGTVTAISGTTLTVTNKSNVSYTVNAASTTVQKAGVSSTIAQVAVGDSIVVQGTVNGTSITASSIMDGGAIKAAGAEDDDSNVADIAHKGMGRIMGGIGGFFHSLFGFF